jgi:glycosyltransferase involved in cell wall biosynthesis
VVIVMIVENAFTPDQRVLKESQALKAAGHEVSVLAWDRLCQFPPYEIVKAVPVKRIRIKSGYGIRWRQMFYIWRFWLLAFYSALKAKPDIIICHDFHTLGAGFLLKMVRRKHLRVIYDIHDMYTGSIMAESFSKAAMAFAWIEKLFTLQFDAFITVGHQMRRHFEKLARQKPLVLVGNWYDPYQSSTVEKEAIMRSIGLNSHKPCVGYIGSIIPGRSIELFGELARLQPEWNIIVAGGREGAEGDPKIREVLRDAQETCPNLFVLGWVSEPLKYFSLLDASIYALDPSYTYHAQYAAPNNLYSCIATGTPMITTRCGELAEVGEKYHFIEFIEQITPRTINIALEKVLSGNITDYRREALRAQNEFNARKATSTLCDLIASL